MPTYEYACGACDHRFEEFHSITAKPVTKCPSCKKRKVKRLVSGGAGFIFKGSGFYITDYRSESYKAAAKGDTAPASAPAASADKGGKSETAGSTAPAAAPAKAESAAPVKSEPTKASKSASKSKK